MSSSPHAAARHVLISGGSRGLGESLVGGLLNAGYRVSSFSRRSTEFTDRQAANPSFFFQTVDISDAKSLDVFLRSAGVKARAILRSHQLRRHRGGRGACNHARRQTGDCDLRQSDGGLAANAPRTSPDASGAWGWHHH